MHEQRLAPDLSQWIVQALSRLLATYAIIQGAGIIVGGVDRWQGPAFRAALTVPGAPATWGLVLLLLGAAALAGTFAPHMRVTAVALFLLGVWCAFFALSFIITFLQVDGAATTGIFTYGHQAAGAFILAVAYRKSRRP